MSIGVAAAANKVEREKDEREEGERASERADERSGERPGLPNIPSPRRALDGRTRTDGRASGGSAFLPPPVAGGHAIRVESVSDCHDGRSVGRGRLGNGQRRFGHSLPNKEQGRIEIKGAEGGREGREEKGFFIAIVVVVVVVTLPNRICCCHRGLSGWTCAWRRESEQRKRANEPTDGRTNGRTSKFCNPGGGVQK